ncbi:MAG: MarR family transcriptional regulator [Vulcanimicrobiaceae bacterium]
MAGKDGSDAALLRSAISALGRRLRGHDRAEGVGATGLLILGRLLAIRSASASELAQLEGLQPQSLTRVLQGLEESGLVERDVDEADRRRAVITITPQGESLLRSAMRRRVASLGRLLDTQLSGSERDTLRAGAVLMHRLAEADASGAPKTDAVFNLIPLVSVADVARSLALYERLGFVEDGRSEDGGRLVWASMHARTVRAARIMFTIEPTGAKPRTQGVRFYCWSDDIAALHTRLTGEGLCPSPIEYPEHMRDGEFRLRDPDGYELVVGQPRRS